MSVAIASVLRDLERNDAAAERDIPFGDLLSAHGPQSEEELAYLIAFDGRVRIDLGLPVTLRRYLEAVHDLSGREVALDAAIEVTLRALSGSGRADRATVETLAGAYPDLAGPIREAGVLAEAVTSTNSLRDRLAPAAPRPLPADFGPCAPGGGRARYELRQLLGRGASGEVFLAVDRQLSEPEHPAMVALKIIAGVGRTARERERLAEEATKARRVIHPNVARVLDRGVSAEGEDYIVYEYIEGGDLDAWLAGQAGAADRAKCRLLARIARGVHAAHVAGLVHCDLKPANILITPDGEPKVADFGVSVRLSEGDRGSVSLGSAPAGNLAFIAPERFRREPGAFSVLSDVYALGGLLHYVLTGRLPNGSTPLEIEHAHRRQSAGGLAGRGAATHDPVLDSIIARAMAPSAGDRYSSAATLADDVDAWVRFEPIAWMRPSPAQRARLWVSRRPIVAALAASLVFASGLGSAGTWYWSTRAAAKSAKVAAFEQQFAEARGAIRDMYKKVGRFRSVQANRDALFLNLMLETVRGPAVPGLMGNASERRAERIKITRDWVAAALAQGRDRDLELLVTEWALGLCLLDSGQASEAERVLAGLLPRLEQVLPQDPFTTEVRLLRASASVQAGARGEALTAAKATLAEAPGFLRSRLTSDAAQDAMIRACLLAEIPCNPGKPADLPSK